MNNKIKEKIISLKAEQEKTDYEKWESATIKANNIILSEFEEALKKEGLAQKTIDKHVNNVDTFVNYYLTTYSYCGTIFDGYKNFDDFFGYWFITKFVGCSKSLILGMIGSMKKFYSFLYSDGYIDEIACSDAYTSMKENKESWLEQVEMYEKGTYFTQFD